MNEKEAEGNSDNVTRTMINFDHPCRGIDVWENVTDEDYSIAVSQGYIPFDLSRCGTMSGVYGQQSSVFEFRNFLLSDEEINRLSWFCNMIIDRIPHEMRLEEFDSHLDKLGATIKGLLDELDIDTQQQT